MNQITKAMLISRLDALNDALDLPREPYAAERDANGGLKASDGVFLLDWAYGGVRLSRMCNGGGERDISGRGTVRECYTFIDALLTGIALAKKQA